MKRFFKIFLLFWIIGLSKAQITPFPINCVSDASLNLPGNPPDNHDPEVELSGACNHTSPYYNQNGHDNILYEPKSNDEVIYVKINFIFLTKPDGTGNFEQNNPEHVEFIDNMINAFNYRMGNLGTPVSGCEAYPQSVLDTRIRVVVNKIWKVDPAWDFLYTGFDPTTNNPYDHNSILIPGSTYYYSYFDTDPTIPQGINITFANNGKIFSDAQNNIYDTVPLGWAASEFPFYQDYDKKLRQSWPDIYNGYLHRKHFAVGNPDFGSPTWETVKMWYYNDMGARAMVHELGHNFGLYHHECGSNIMSYSAGNHDYLSMKDVSLMFQNSSISNFRQYVTKESFKNTNIGVTNNEIWDLNFRLYSNVKIDNNSSLKATCKIVMAPESRFVVKDGSNFIMEGADVSSANNNSWNGIKVEGTGYFLINPDTRIDNGYFFAYTNNRQLAEHTNGPNDPNNKLSKDIVTDNKLIGKDYKIYPNPTGDFINIETTSKILKVEVYNLLNKSFSTNYKDNRVDVRNLPQGNYVLKIFSNSGDKTIHFIKN